MEIESTNLWGNWVDKSRQSSPAYTMVDTQMDFRSPTELSKGFGGALTYPVSSRDRWDPFRSYATSICSIQTSEKPEMAVDASRQLNLFCTFVQLNTSWKSPRCEKLPFALSVDQQMIARAATWEVSDGICWLWCALAEMQVRRTPAVLLPWHPGALRVPSSQLRAMLAGEQISIKWPHIHLTQKLIVSF